MASDKPNLTLPMAPSYDTRANARTQTQAGVDQRKVNMLYDNVINSVTGQQTVQLAKRPGIAAYITNGTVNEYGYLVVRIGAPTSANYWNINVYSGNIRASNNSTDTTIEGDASGTKMPAYVTTTTISGTDYAVVQIKTGGSDVAHDVFYASTIGTWTQISDADFTGLKHRGQMVHMDGYAFVMDSLNRVYQSDLNSISAWTAGNYITKQIEQDSPAGLAKFKNQLLAFGDNTCEVFYNAGNASGSVLKGIPTLQSRVGLSSIHGSNDVVSAYKTHYYCTIGDTMFFLGHGAGSAGGALYAAALWAWNGSRMEHVSSPAIDRYLSENTIYGVYAVNIFGRDAVALNTSAPSNATHQWLMFFLDSKSWFEWESTVFSTTNYEGIHQHAQGASKRGLYSFSNMNKWQDDSTAYTATVQFAIPADGDHMHYMRWLSLDCDTARSASTVGILFSDDDYQTFSTQRDLDISVNRKRLTRCGSFRNRSVRLTHSDNLPFRINNVMARIE